MAHDRETYFHQRIPIVKVPEGTMTREFDEYRRKLEDLIYELQDTIDELEARVTALEP